MIYKRGLFLTAALCASLTGLEPAAAQSQDTVLGPVIGTNQWNYIAQGVDPSRPVDEARPGVLERSRPEYDARGVRIGGFVLYPSLATTYSFDDNIFSLPGGTLPVASANLLGSAHKKSDTITHIVPAIVLQSDWTAHSLKLYGNADAAYFTNRDTENVVNGKVGLIGTIDVMHDMRVRYYGEWLLNHEDRGMTALAYSSTVFDKPVEYNQTTAGVAVNKQFNRFAVTTSSDYKHVEYVNPRLNGVEIDQSFRNGDIYTIKNRLGYEISPLTRIFTEYGYEQRKFVNASFDNNGQRAVVGVSGELSRLVRGEIYGGYLGQYYGQGINDVHTVAYGGLVNWYATPLVTFVLTGERSVNETLYGGSGTYIQSKLVGRADYEFRRNIIFSGKLGYEWDDFQDAARNDTLFATGISGTYLFSRNFKMMLDYTHGERESSAALLGYTRNIYTVSGQVQF